MIEKFDIIKASNQVSEMPVNEAAKILLIALNIKLDEVIDALNTMERGK